LWCPFSHSGFSGLLLSDDIVLWRISVQLNYATGTD
jgi:hypothetical protein